MTSFLVLIHERVRYCNGTLKPNDNRWCDHIANDNINNLQNASKLHLQKLNDSLAKEPISTQGKSATWMLSTKKQSPVNWQTQLQASKCKLSKKLLQLVHLIWVPFWWHLRWLEKWSGLLSMKGIKNTPWPSFPSVKDTQDSITQKVERLCILWVVLKQQQVSTWALPSSIVPNNDNHWCDHLANDNINHLRDASTLRLPKLDDSLAKEPISTHGKCATWTLAQKSRSPVNCQTQLQASKCKPSKKLLQLLHFIWVVFRRHLRWLEK